ncbi:MAG: hypothetical protein JXA30_13530 [Deltaproteobacteria bacterium]|nr:hypothetical protein [Deltaproteobacteria bacterium]
MIKKIVSYSIRNSSRVVVVFFVFTAVIISYLPSQAQAQEANLIEIMRLHRIRLGVQTCDVKDADTDNRVYLRLTESDKRYYLDRPAEDRKRNSWDYYEVLMPEVTYVGHITRLGLHKHGTDGWCIKQIRLYFNGWNTPVFSRSFNGQWIDNDDGHKPSYTINSKTLRASANWNVNTAQAQTMCAVPSQLANGYLKDLVKGLIGDIINDVASPEDVRKLYWGYKHDGNFVDLWQKDGNTLEGDLDLGYKLDDWTDPEVDVNMKIDVSCSGGNPSLRGYGIKVTADGDDVLDWLTFGIQDLIVNSINDDLANMTEGIEQTIGINTFGLCAGMNVDASGNINIIWNIMNPMTWIMIPYALCLPF